MNFIYGLKEINSDGSEWWVVHNYKRQVSCSSELACWKVIDLSNWINGTLNYKPVNHKTLEAKADFLINGNRKYRKRRVKTV